MRMQLSDSERDLINMKNPVSLVKLAQKRVINLQASHKIVTNATNMVINWDLKALVLNYIDIYLSIPTYIYIHIYIYTERMNIFMNKLNYNLN